MSTTPETAPPTSASGSLLKAAGLMAVLLLVSKLAGFGRDIFIAQTYGFSTATDAYFAAFQLPQFSLILLGGLGGPFHTATVSIFSSLLDRGEDGSLSPSPKAKALARTITTLIAAIFAVLSVVVYFNTTPIMSLILGAGAKPELITLAASQLKIMSPVILVGGLVGFLYGALNMLHVYVWPALSPVVMSVVMILALFIFGGDANGSVLAWSSLVGAFLQLALQLPEFFGKGFSFMPSLSKWQSPEIKKWFDLLWPALLGSTMGQLMIYVDMFFAAGLPEGAWSAVVFSNRLIQLPLGVLQTALLVPLFPRLVELVDQGKEETLGKTLVKGIGALWFVAFPIMLLLGLAPLPFIQSIFSRGNFATEDAIMLAVAIAWQSLQIIPYFARDTITRVFYAYKDSKTPMLVGVVAIGMKALFNWILISKLNLGVAGITASITLITIFNLGVLGYLLKRNHYTALPIKELSITLGKLSLASLPILGLLVLGNQTLPLLPIQHPMVQAGYLSVLSLGVGGVFYVLACKWLGLTWVEETLIAVRKKILKR